MGLGHLIPPPVWDTVRHIAFRNLQEVVWATLLVRMVLVKAPEAKPQTKVDAALMKLGFANPHQGHRATLWQIIYALLAITVLTLIVGIIGVYLAYYGGPALWHQLHHGSAFHASWHLTPWLATEAQNFPWQALAIGLPCAFLAKFIFSPPAADFQLFFIEVREVKAQIKKRFAEAKLLTWQKRLLAEPKFPYPPNYRERYRARFLAKMTPADHGFLESRLTFALAAFLGPVMVGYGIWLTYAGPAAGH
jgi:uncharacterized membrane protein